MLTRKLVVRKILGSLEYIYGRGVMTIAGIRTPRRQNRYKDQESFASSKRSILLLESHFTSVGHLGSILRHPSAIASD